MATDADTILDTTDHCPHLNDCFSLLLVPQIYHCLDCQNELKRMYLQGLLKSSLSMISTVMFPCTIAVPERSLKM